MYKMPNSIKAKGEAGAFAVWCFGYNSRFMLNSFDSAMAKVIIKNESKK